MTSGIHEVHTQKYANDTCLQTRGPWSIFIGGLALCPDGKVRRLHTIAQCADSFFSIPASVQVTVNPNLGGPSRRITVSGFVSIDTQTLNDSNGTVRFSPQGKNKWVFEPAQTEVQTEAPETQEAV